KYEPVGTSALRFSNLQGVTYTMTLGGQAVPVTGGTTIVNSMIAAKEIDGYKIETTSSRNGAVTGKSTLALSRDGKTMTVTTTQAGPTASLEPSVAVFE